jgi:hypothetical protein
VLAALRIGNVASVTNHLDTGRTATYTYDALNRVTSGKSSASSGADCWGQSVPSGGYDRYGNLLTINSSQCSNPVLALTVNTYNQVTNPSFSYDAEEGSGFVGRQPPGRRAASKLKCAPIPSARPGFPPGRKEKPIVKSNSLRKAFYSITVMLAVPAILAAAPAKASTASSDSLRSPAPMEASDLLVQMRTDAMRVRDLAYQWETYNRDPFLIDWRLHGHLLDRMRDRVNAMDETFIELQEIRQDARPWQQKVIGRIAPKVVELSDSTQWAINYLTDHRTYLFNPAYTAQATYMSHQANRIVRTVANYEKVASAERTLRRLSPELGLQSKTGA